MSSNKNDLDFAGTHLPSDLLTPSLGSNYGMDGFEDMQYGLGVLEGVLDPALHRAPALPDGVTQTAAAEMNLTAMMETELADLKWLDPSQEQDEERLPQTPEMIPELVNAWGVDRRTDGVSVEAHQKELSRARYEQSLADKGTPKRANERTMTRVVTHAMRRSVEGQHIDRIVREACESMGAEFSRIVPHLRMVKAEHGLVGNVFVRAAAYPGWSNGKGKKHVKKHAPSAKYIIVTAGDLEQATWIQDGRCAYTGKKAVVEIPWKEAYAHYAPRLRATGRKVASGDPRAALQASFLSLPETKTAESHKPREIRAGEVSFGHEFRQQFDVDPEAVGINHVATVDGFLWDGDPTGSRVKAADDLRTALEGVAALRESGTYSGDVLGIAPMTRTEVTLSDENAAIAKAASEGGVSGNEIRNTLRAARRAMSEGLAGKDLTSYITHRFASSVLSASKGLLAGLRSRHEGASGFLYVDAQAYASASGAGGCEKAASKHRANQIPSVAAMPRCASCTLARPLEDGTRKCGVYNKLLLTDTTGNEIEQIKAKNIKQAEMSDAETVASYFAPSYDPAEFGLHNANLDNIEQAPLTETEKLGEILFDGWTIS